MLKLCLTVILLGCVTQINCENLPVFMWGQKTPSYLPALQQLNGDEFVTLVKSQADKETLTVVFVEKSLSAENLSQCKLKTQTCFENLKKVEQKTYLTAVEDPVEALEASFSKQSQKSISLSNEGDLSDYVDGGAAILFVYLDDVDSDEDFAKHDELMSKLYNSIASKRENVIAIYTAVHPSFVYSKPLVRKTREAEADPAEADPKAEAKPADPKAEAKPAEPKIEAKADDTPNPEARQEATPEADQIVLVNDRFLFAFNRLMILNTEIPISEVVLTVNESTAAHEVSAVLTHGTDKITFNIWLSAGTWYVRTFFYNDKRFFSNGPVSAYHRKSFGCGDLRLNHANELIIIGNVQMQAAFGAEEKLEKFSNYHNDCVGFFSAGIWAALFVVFLLLAIFSWGIMMIMDIRTMDRFDDPKGKTITVTAQD